jgi:putative transposase
VDEVFVFRTGHKLYLYRPIDEDGVVIDVLLREHRDTASAQAFFQQAIERTGVTPTEVVTDRHQPYSKAVAATRPGARHIRTGLHRACAETTKAVERSHVPTRDRLRNSRGLKRTGTGQRFLEGFEAVRHLRRGEVPGAGHLVPGRQPHARQAGSGCHACARTRSAPVPLSARSSSRAGTPGRPKSDVLAPVLNNFPNSLRTACGQASK